MKNRLDHIGFDIKYEEIFSSLTAAHNLIKSRELKPMLLISESALEVCNNLYTVNHEIKTCFAIDSCKIESQNLTSPVQTLV